MNKWLNCLTDCQADCCRCLELSFPFSEEEAETLINTGSVLEIINTTVGPLYQLKYCAFLQDNKCLIHDKKEQPKCCREVKPGSPSCLFARKNTNNKLND